MSNRLVVFGDSWTFGCDIVDPKFLSDPTIDIHSYEFERGIDNEPYRNSNNIGYHIATRFGLHYNNLSNPGASNTDTYNSVFEYVSKNKQSLIDDFLLIGMNTPFRIHTFINDSYGKITEETLQVTFPEPHKFERFGKIMAKQLMNWFELETKYFTNIENYINVYLKEFLSMVCILQQSGANYLIFQSFDDIRSEISPFYKTIFSENRHLNLHDSTWYTYIMENETQGDTGHHPNEKEHKIYADHLINHIEINNLL